MKLRPYQQAAIDAVYAHLRDHDDNPCVVIPTAGGKTPVMATICKDAVLRWDGRVLILAHVKELLQQAAEKLQAVCPEVQVGIYSAGLGSRDTLSPVILAGIHSAYRRVHEFGHFDLAIVDEAHMIQPDGDGMYRTFLGELKKTNPLLRVIGLTATPFRMSTGPICAPENILNSICYEVGVRELIDQGYLCPLVTKAGRLKADTDKLRVRGGEYIASDVETLMDDEALVHAACKEIVEFTLKRRSCLIFTSGVKHGDHVAQTLKSMGQNVATIYGDTFDFMREKTIADFKAGRLKFLVNVNVLTTGFDAPNIDCVALLRPTLSPGLYYQMVGRGFRLHPIKENCLILDFGGNALRHGPVDMLRIGARPFSAGDGVSPSKECPQCQGIIAAGHTLCPYCGYEFERQRAKHDAEASDLGVLSDQVTDRKYDVQNVSYYVHYKREAPPDAPRTLRVEYQVGWQQHRSEWVCIEHSGYARLKAEKWWAKRCSMPAPLSVEEAVQLAEAGALCQTKTITTRQKAGEKYEQIIAHELGEIPPALEGQPVSECPGYGWLDHGLIDVNTPVSTAAAAPGPAYVPACDDIPF